MDRPTSPIAKVVHASKSQTLWLIKWPSNMAKQGKSYYATTYPDSDLLFIETAAQRRHVAALVASKISPQIRNAISEARTKLERQAAE